MNLESRIFADISILQGSSCAAQIKRKELPDRMTVLFIFGRRSKQKVSTRRLCESGFVSVTAGKRPNEPSSDKGTYAHNAK